MSYTPICTHFEEIQFPFYVLKKDLLWLGNNKMFVFDRRMTFNSRQQLLDYIETGMTEEEKQDLRDDHIAGDEPETAGGMYD